MLTTILIIAGLAAVILVPLGLNTIALPGTNSFAAPTATRLFNRSGGTMTRGMIGFIDSASSDAASTSLSLAFNNVIKPTTALIAISGKIPVVLLSDSVADDAEGLFCVCDDPNGVIVPMLVESTTDIAKGDLLKGVNAQYYAVKGTQGTDLMVAEALEARTSNDTGIINCRLFPQQRL